MKSLAYQTRNPYLTYLIEETNKKEYVWMLKKLLKNLQKLIFYLDELLFTRYMSLWINISTTMMCIFNKSFVYDFCARPLFDICTRFWILISN